MYLNVGADILIREDDIVGIFDLDSASVEVDTRNMLREKEKIGMVIQAGYELPKSFVFTADGRIYLSQFSSSVLKGGSRRMP